MINAQIALASFDSIKLNPHKNKQCRASSDQTITMIGHTHRFCNIHSNKSRGTTEYCDSLSRELDFSFKYGR